MQRRRQTEDTRLGLLLATGVGGLAVQLIGIPQAIDPLLPASFGMFITLLSGTLFLAYRLAQES